MKVIAQAMFLTATIAVILAACTAASPPAASPETLQLGARLYAENCQTCHGDRQGKGRIPAAPSHGPDGHTWHHSDRNLREVILNGATEMTEQMRRMMGVPDDAPRMPAWKDKLSQDDINAILAYIKTFWTDEQRQLQAETPMMP